MAAGDKLWAQGKTEPALQAYRASIALDPSDWRPYERLATLLAAVGLFDESRRVLAVLQTLQSKPPPDVVTYRYGRLRLAVDKRFQILMTQYYTDAGRYAAKKINREKYYSLVRDVGSTLSSMASLVDAMTVPPEKRTINLHRSLACGLAAQAAAGLADYLETDNERLKSDADAFMEQARTEHEQVQRMEAGKLLPSPGG